MCDGCGVGRARTKARVTEMNRVGDYPLAEDCRQAV
jgi:hypothetical protein